jgi:hypothetical protein
MDLKSILEKLAKGEALTSDELSFMKALKTINPDSVKDYLEKDEAGKKLLNSITDARVTKGIETFKKETMPSLIEEEIKKKFPAETEEQKRLRLLEEDNKKFQNDVKRERLLNKAISIANERKLPLKLIDRFLGDDEETTIKNIELLEAEYNSAITSAVESKFKEHGREPGNNDKNTPPDYSKMTDEQYFQQRLSEQKK